MRFGKSIISNMVVFGLLISTAYSQDFENRYHEVTDRTNLSTQPGIDFISSNQSSVPVLQTNYSTDNCTETSCTDSNSCCNARRLFVVGGVDFTYFDFYASQGAGGQDSNGNTDDYFPNYDTNFDVRPWIGIETDKGYGLRTRFWRWDDTVAFNGIDRTQSIETYDLEVTLKHKLRYCQLTAFGGARWSNITLQGSDFGGLDPSNFDGVGPTLGLDLKRSVFNTRRGELGVFGGFRYSILVGETDFVPGPTSVLDNTFIDIFEVSLGAEWSRPLGDGNQRLFVRGAYEFQTYSTDTYYPFAIDPETPGDVLLGGPVLSVGITR